MRARSSTLFTALMRPTKAKDSLTPFSAASRTPTAGFGAAAAGTGGAKDLPCMNQTTAINATTVIAAAIAAQRPADIVLGIVRSPAILRASLQYSPNLRD